MEMGNQSLASGKPIMPIKMVTLSGKAVFLASIIKRDSVTAASDSIPSTPEPERAYSIFVLKLAPPFD